jgi:hypothetical protein
MMAFPEEESHAADIFGTDAYEAPRPPKKDFLPWHRPRKQFVRDRQWCAQIEDLLKDVELEDNLLRYLGLPGVDLLDLRYFHSRLCEPKQIRLRFLGFNNGAHPTSQFQPELNISLDEVRRLSLVDPRSDVIWDDFSQIANEDSIAWKKTREHGPYDVVNLDLCDGFGLHAPGTFGNSHYNAMVRLLSLQARSKRPWLLLLTTRSGSDHVHTDVLEAFLKKYLANLSTCEPFRNASKEKFTIGDEDALKGAMKTELGHLIVFLTGLCKWLLSLVTTHKPPSKLEVKSVLGYRVSKACTHEDLISLAFRFDPTFTPVADPLGLAIQHGPLPDECALSTKALKRIINRKNVDAILLEDVALRQEMTNAMAALLEVARYDVESFHAWVTAG